MRASIEGILRAATSAAPVPPHPWPEDLPARLARTAGRPGLPPPPLRADALAARLAEALGVPAFEQGGAIWAHPALLAGPNGPACRHVLAHEAAHVLQRGGALADGPLGPEPAAEAEAEHFAAALEAGRAARVAPRAGLPALQPAIPLLAILLIAGLGLTIGGVAIDARRREEREAEGLPPEQRDPHLHETAWGLIPFVGSIDQLWSGENWATQAGGAVFLVLDLSLVGGVVAKGLVKGSLVFGTRASVREGLAGVARGGGNAAQRQAATQLGEAAARGEIRLGTQEAIEEVVRRQVLNAEGPVLITGTTGWLNHSVTFLVVDGKLYKLHGGIMRTAYPVLERPLAEGATGAWARRFNRMTVFGGEQALTDAALREQVAFWQQMNAGFGNRAMNALMAQGCSGSQAMLLERLGLYQAGLGERMFPYFLDRGLVGAGRASYLVNPWRAAAGSAVQTSLYLAAGGLYESRAMLNMLKAPPAGVYFSHNLAKPEVPAVIAEGATWADYGFSPRAPLPPSVDIAFPAEVTFRDADPTAVKATVVGQSRRAAPRHAPKPAALPPLPSFGIPNSDFGFPSLQPEAPPDGVVYDEASGVCRPALPEDHRFPISPLR